MRRKTTRPPTLEEVAVRAGVSPATASRFFNQPKLVAQRTAARIKAAVTATGYVHNLLANGVASNRSRMVAVLVPEVANSIFNDTIEAMTAELDRDGNVVMLGLTHPDESRLVPLIEAALGRRAEGVILTAVLTDPRARKMLRDQRATVIETWGLPADPIDVAVGFSHDAVGRAVARFVRDRGYRRPHLVVPGSLRARQRRDGFVAAWPTARGLARPTEMDTSSPGRFAHGRAVVRGILDARPRPDVVICTSDLLAQGVIVEALAAGLRVPDDLAVVGFGNLSIANEMRPTITTVDVDGARIGREAVSVLRRRAAGEILKGHVMDVGFEIIARESA